MNNRLNVFIDILDIQTMLAYNLGFTNYELYRVRYHAFIFMYRMSHFN